MRRFAAACACLSLVLAACDRSAPTDTTRLDAPAEALVDGSAGGNPHFFFLAPVAAQPKFSGVFNQDIAPTVEICANTSQNALGHCTSLLASYTRTPKQNGQVIEVSLTGQHYLLSWQAKSFAIADNAPFRIVVMVGDIQLGYFDMVKRANSFRNADNNEIISRNSTVPIKFRIERGALCQGATECFEGLVGPAGGTFTITRADGFKTAGTEFPSGALNQTVTLVISRVVTNECLPTDVPQYQGCYRFETHPHVENFNLPATVGVCMLDLAGVPFFEDQQLRLWKWSEVNGDPIQELERIVIEYLECPAPTALSARGRSSLMLGATRAGSLLLKPLAALFGPRAAYADVLGYEGGKLSNFSRIGWVRPLSVEIRAGDNQTGNAGQPLPIMPKVRVRNKYGLTAQGVPGRTVQFHPSQDGTATPPSTITDSNGEASTTWTLAGQPGQNTLNVLVPLSRAIAPVPYEAEVSFNALGNTPVQLVWLPSLVATWDTNGTDVMGLAPTVEIKAGADVVLATLETVASTDGYTAFWTVPVLDPAQTYRLTVKLAGHDVGFLDLVVKRNSLRNSLTDGVVLNLDTSRSLLIRFRLIE